MFQACCQQFSGIEADGLLKYLTEEEQKEAKDSFVSYSLSIPTAQIRKMFHRIHYSWLSELFSNFPKDKQALYLRALNSSQSKGLSSLLGTSFKQAPIPKLASEYLLGSLTLAHPLATEVQREFLEKSSFSPLLDFDKSRLVNLIDLLGIFDLAAEVKKVVEKTRLKEVYLWLNQQQQAFLKNCLRQEDVLTEERQGIHSWTKNQKAFLHKIHLKGLARFSQALKGESSKLVWHLTRTLDKGRGEVILKSLEKVEKSDLQSALQKQVFSTHKFLSEYCEQ